MTTREEVVLRRLLDMQERYKQEAQPLVDELVEIEACKPPRPIFIPINHTPACCPSCGRQLPGLA